MKAEAEADAYQAYQHCGSNLGQNASGATAAGIRMSCGGEAEPQRQLGPKRHWHDSGRHPHFMMKCDDDDDDDGDDDDDDADDDDYDADEDDDGDGDDDDGDDDDDDDDDDL